MSGDGDSPPKLSSRLGRLRSLTPDEEDLWSLVARTVRPLRPAAPVRKVAKQLTMNQLLADGEKKESPRPVKSGPLSEPKAPVPAHRSAAPPALSPVMRKERQKLARGHETIDARIDLHGMTQTEAHAALRSLLQRSQANGAKFVLVITGKGQPSASLNGRGVLRRQVPMWLALPEFRRYVAGFDIAGASHGGEGALYVRLRKAKVTR
jgi:DNA-nicking Smr family endonuclease